VGWFGTMLVGMAIGLAGRVTLPCRTRLGYGTALLMGGIGALLVKYLGQAAGLFRDGEMGGWLAVLVGVTLMVLMCGAVFRQRR
jgi:uncharacterized membrane protein YeaQ/YmgE (transglycosylase-associated protein family)